MRRAFGRCEFTVSGGLDLSQWWIGLEVHRLAEEESGRPGGVLAIRAGFLCLAACLFMARPSGRRCRECGCTDDRACPGGCCWVAVDLCSRCGPDGLRIGAYRPVDESRGQGGLPWAL